MYILSFIIAIFFSSLSIYTLDKIINKYVNNRFLSSLISISIIINPFIIELWLFVEMGIMMLSIFSMIKAFTCFDNYLDKKNQRLLLKSLIWMIIGVFSYQGTMALFVCLSLISIINHSKNVKLYFKNNIFMFFIYFIPIIINYIFILMFSRNRVGGIYNFQRTISTIIGSTKYIVNGFGLFPK